MSAMIWRHPIVGDLDIGTAWIGTGFGADPDAIFPTLGAFPNPDMQIEPPLTFNGPITVTTTHNYTSDSVFNAPSITFQTTNGATATFLSAQFVSGGIATNATINGDAHTDTIAVDLGRLSSFDGSALKLVNWSANDSFRITGTNANETITGTSGKDIITVGGAGSTISAGAGNDTINMGGYLAASDHIDGGSGNNTLNLSGDYSAGLFITSSMLQNVERMNLAGGHSYNFTIDAGVVAAGQAMTINGTALGAGNNLTLDVSSDPAGRYIIDGGNAFNKIILNNQIDYVYGGSDQTYVYTNGVMSTNDQIHGAGITDLFLNGDYSAGYTFKAATISDLQQIFLTAGHSYNLTTNDANVAAGASLNIDASGLGTGDSFTFNGSHETDGQFNITGGAGLDRLLGGAGNDEFNFFGNGEFTAADHINGGGGYNTFLLSGDYSAGLHFGALTITNIQDIELAGGYSYNLTIANANVGVGQTLQIDGGSLGAGDTLVFDGSSETNGNLVLNGGAGNDTLIGGAGNDTFDGGGGADSMTAGSGDDTFVYFSVGESTSTTHDTITGFDALKDHIQISIGSGFNGSIDTAVNAGTLTNANFDANLASAIGAAQLHAGDAVLFSPNAGDLSGHTFLIIDENGVAGYQAGQDLVIDITGASNLSHFSAANFT